MKQDGTAVISVISGKGGTGKTLLTAVLGRALSREGFNVLLVDLDIFVRGLTILLSHYIQKRPVDHEGVTISDLLSPNNFTARAVLSSQSPGLAVSRFFECDFLPATKDIGEPIDYDEKMFTSLDFNKEFMDQFLFAVRGKYDFVLLDCRAGIDSHIVAIASRSDFIISVAEDDDVCLQANTNLINHLRYRQSIKNVYTLINKGRRITSYSDLKEKALQRGDFNYMGVMPFDIEVMEDFGKERFWSTVYETLYFRALIDAWNYFAGRNGLGKISINKYRFPASILMGPRSGQLPLVQRMLRLYGIMFGGVGVFLLLYDLVRRWRFLDFSSYEVVAYVSFALGMISLLLSNTNLRRWLLGQTDKPEQK